MKNRQRYKPAYRARVASTTFSNMDFIFIIFKMSGISVKHVGNEPKELLQFGFTPQITSVMLCENHVSKVPLAHFQIGFGISADRAGQARRARVKMDSMSPSSEGRDVVHFGPRGPLGI
jgi:hypothetical protein